MNRRIRILGLVLLACFGLLFLQLNNIQVRESKSLSANPNNQVTQVNPYVLPRGEILSADGTVLAYSKATSDGYGEQRIYPAATANLFADVTGYASVAVENSTGLEREYNQYLTQHESSVSTLGQLLHQFKQTDNVTITISLQLQRLAAYLLAGRDGAVVALDPRTGAILAMYGNPTFNPNLLVVHSYSKVISNYNKLVNTSPDPLVNYATQVAHAPGSTFKIIDLSTIFTYKPKIANIVWPFVSSVSLPSTNLRLHNYASELCGGPLYEAFARSCDTAFGTIGLDLGAQDLFNEAQAYGFNEVPPLDLPAGEVNPSVFPAPQSFVQNQPGLAYSAIGQENVQATALQMALTAGAIADGGVIMTPHLLDHVDDSHGVPVTSYHPHPWRRVVSAAAAAKIRSLMIGVTQLPYGTAYLVFSGVSATVAAKTGTAQILSTGCGTYNWLVAFAPAGTGQVPSVALVAVVPSPPGNACVSETGAGVAGPVLSAMLQGVLAAQAGKG